MVKLEKVAPESLGKERERGSCKEHRSMRNSNLKMQNSRLRFTLHWFAVKSLQSNVWTMNSTVCLQTSPPVSSSTLSNTSGKSYFEQFVSLLFKIQSFKLERLKIAFDLLFRI